MLNIITALFLAGFLGACTGVLKPERTFSKNGLTITFRSINHLGNIRDLRFQYPIHLSEETIRKHLLSLYHQNIENPKKPRPVFSPQEVKEFTPLFITVLKKVETGKYLHFKFRSSGRQNEGGVFLTPKKIHWRFIKINNEYFSNDPLKIRKPTWKLVRKPGQDYKMLQTGRFKKALKNWIIADINLTIPQQRSRSRKKSPPGNLTSPKSRGSELREKMDTLQELLETGLINDNEYRKKKESLLDEYLKARD